MKVRLTPEAEADIDEAIAWYDGRGQGLGDEFLRCVDARIALMERFPKAFPFVHRNIRRVLVRRFPYYLVYEIEDSEIVIYGAYHCARDPRSWKRRRRKRR